MKVLLQCKNFDKTALELFTKHKSDLAMYTNYKGGSPLRAIYTGDEKVNYKEFEKYRIQELGKEYGIKPDVVEYEILRACTVIGNSYPLFAGGRIYDLRGRIKARGTVEMSYRLNMPYLWGQIGQNYALYGPVNFKVFNELLNFIKKEPDVKGINFDLVKKRIVIIVN